MRRFYSPVVYTIAVLLFLPLLVACVTNNPRPQVVEGGTPRSDNFMTVVAEPGGGGRCSTTPCSVYYRTPDAGAPVAVIVNNQVVGNFPPNTVVFLGNFMDHLRISIQGSDTPTAFVSVPNNTNR